jgi:hypothetical protein
VIVVSTLLDAPACLVYMLARYQRTKKKVARSHNNIKRIDCNGDLQSTSRTGQYCIMVSTSFFRPHHHDCRYVRTECSYTRTDASLLVMLGRSMLEVQVEKLLPYIGKCGINCRDLFRCSQSVSPICHSSLSHWTIHSRSEATTLIPSIGYSCNHMEHRTIQVIRSQEGAITYGRVS